ncbi:FAD-dependent oxidoreductase [Streptomyces sp. ODS28]|uniref:FAD-dependent oxidoreductase n=1 Tax=Streptomyces sp. ODS28 TaxID=3136688 RepID=UPI0031E596A7
MTLSTDVVVIGAGLTGASAAWAISRAGRSVVLLEARGFGHRQGSSHGTERIFRRVYPDPHYLALTGQAERSWHTLEADAGTHLLRVTGGIDHGAGRDVPDLARLLTAEGVRHEVLTPEQAAERWPGFAFGGPVLHQPDAGVIDADATVATLLETARRRGARTLEHAPVEAVETAGNHAVVHPAGGAEPILARRVVLAVGGWLPELAPGIPVRLPPLEVTQQQVYHFAQRDPRAVWPTLVHDEGMLVYGLPSGADGGPRPAVKVARHHGGTRTTASGRTGVVDAADRERVTAYVRDWLPGLHPEPVAEATCLYTSTADEDFVLDRRGPLVVASPCSGHGAKFAPLLGEMIRDLAVYDAAAHPRFALDRPGPARPVGQRV